jgi:endo-1,4-beta-mannosidase
MKFTLIFFLFFSTSTYSVERADAFIVTAFNKNFKVLSPAKRTKKVSVIIENKTLVKLIGEIVNERETIREIITIKPGKYKSVELKFKKNTKYYFVPLSPAFQRVVLDFGKKAYEIPTKK